ncbi:MAG TPA: hypothetical protein PKH31_02795, partial [Candidatus Sumerlaeota bacterium]|nr:hypothetical protein [Candidatus Sumerlaeota bacterium]
MNLTPDEKDRLLQKLKERIGALSPEELSPTSTESVQSPTLPESSRFSVPPASSESSASPMSPEPSTPPESPSNAPSPLDLEKARQQILKRLQNQRTPTRSRA